MLFSSRLSLSNVIELCRVLRHSLGAGLTLRDVFRGQAKRGLEGVRPVAARINAVLEQGGGLDEALKQEAAAFPPLFTALAGVGEQTGMLPEVFTELEKYFVRQRELRRTFVMRTAWPAIVFFLAVFAGAGLILVMGLLPQQEDNKFKVAWDPMGLGLSGPGGALTFLAVVFGFLALLVAAYVVLTRVLGRKAGVDAFLLRVPLLGRCLRALALSRFCLALRLTLETAMPTTRALKLSFRATDNEAFLAKQDEAVTAVKEGEDLTLALTATGLFPEEFRHILSVAEESGRLTEVLRQEAEHYHEEADRRLRALNGALIVGVGLLVAGFVVFLIFRIFSAYVGLIDQFAS
jgi:type IV pilus assembly protein PilC